ncbi:MAG: hypothetical protein Q9157_005875 [Trypethelium eluteriae]
MLPHPAHYISQYDPSTVRWRPTRLHRLPTARHPVPLRRRARRVTDDGAEAAERRPGAGAGSPLGAVHLPAHPAAARSPPDPRADALVFRPARRAAVRQGRRLADAGGVEVAVGPVEPSSASCFPSAAVVVGAAAELVGAVAASELMDGVRGGWD